MTLDELNRKLKKINPKAPGYIQVAYVIDKWEIYLCNRFWSNKAKVATVNQNFTFWFASGEIKFSQIKLLIEFFGNKLNNHAR